MNPKILKSIMQAYDICRQSFDYDCCDKAAEILLSIIRAETCGKTRSKFNIFDFCAQDQLRPVMNGIYHEGGFKIASDSHVLLQLKEDYDESLEGKVIGKDGKEIEGRYPKYKQVIPNEDEDGFIKYHLDIDSFYNQLKEKRTAIYQDCGKKSNWNCNMIVKVGESCFTAQLFDKMVRLMQYLGTDNLYIKDSSHAALVVQGESKAIIMPRRSPDINEYPAYYIIKL